MSDDMRDPLLGRVVSSAKLLPRDKGTLVGEALTLRVDDAVWTRRGRFSAAAANLADRHYSREVIGSPQVGGPGRLLVFVTPDERAVWITKQHVAAAVSPRAIADGFMGYRCAMFRNESSARASDLIQAATDLTERLWGVSAHGWMTYVDRSRIASVNPGYCFKMAGWTLDRDYDHPHLVRLWRSPYAR